MKMMYYESRFVGKKQIEILKLNSSFCLKMQKIEQENAVLKSLLTKQRLLGGNESSST